MKVSSIKTVYEFMRYCRMPLCFQRSIRDMKVGDTFILGKYTQPVSHDGKSYCLPSSSDNSEPSFVAEAWIEKERGKYAFYGTWTFPTKPERSFIMTWGDFKISKGGIVILDDEDSFRSFALICRYLSHMLEVMPYDVKDIYFKKNSSPLLNGVWLDSDCTERRVRAIQQADGKIKRVWINYKDYMPTHQLSAVVEASICLGLIPELSYKMRDVIQISLPI